VQELSKNRDKPIKHTVRVMASFILYFLLSRCLLKMLQDIVVQG